MSYDALKIDNQLCFPLYAASKEVIRKYKPLLDPLGLTYTQYIVMLVLWQEQKMNVKSLGEVLYLDSGTLTPLLKKLEKQGLLVRSRSKEDERNLYIEITDKGKELKDQAINIPYAIGNCLNISEEEAKTLYSILYKILK